MNVPIFWAFKKKNKKDLFKVNNRTRKRCKICSKLTIETPELSQWRRSGVFILNVEHISHLCVSIVDSEQVNINWVNKRLTGVKIKFHLINPFLVSIYIVHPLKNVSILHSPESTKKQSFPGGIKWENWSEKG